MFNLLKMRINELTWYSGKNKKKISPIKYRLKNDKKSKLSQSNLKTKLL